MVKRDLWKLGLFLLLIAVAAQIEIFGCFPVLAAVYMAIYMEDFHRGKILIFCYVCMILWLPMTSLAKYAVLLLVSMVAVLFAERMYQSCRRIYGAAVTGVVTVAVSYGGSVLQITRMQYRWIPVLEGMLVFSLCFFANRGAFWLIQKEWGKKHQWPEPEDERLRSYAQAMGGLSKTFASMSRIQENSPVEMEYMCRELVEKVCCSCSQCAVCTTKNAKGAGVLQRLLQSLWETGRVEEGLKKDLEKRCVCSEEVLEESVRIFEKANLNLAWYNRLIENRELIAGQIDAMAGCLKECIHKEKQVDDREKGRILSLQFRLRERGLRPGRIHFYERSDGTKKLTMELSAGRGKYIPMKEVLPVIGSCVGEAFVSVESNYRFVGRDKNMYTFVSRPTYACSHGIARLTKEGQEISGDNFSAVEYSCGHYLFALSDGMGSGWQANRESETVLELLEQFVAADFSMEVALRLMNAAMVFGGSQERYSTLDVCMVDGYTGICEFYKVGAHVSFIKHRSGVEVVAEESLPMGAADQIDTVPWRGHLEVGDMLVMITDGVLEYLEGPYPLEVLRSILERITEPSPKLFTRRVLENVLIHTEGKIHDDMTVLAIRTQAN